MRVTSDQLVGDAVRDILQVEAALIGGDLRMEQHLQQQVAEFFDEVGILAVLDRPTTSAVSSIRYVTSDRCVCSASHGTHGAAAP